jgi:arginyl-tRNA synthetase
MTFLEELLISACDTLFNLSVMPVLTRPDEQFGDYATNVALQLAKPLEQKPVHIAEQIKDYIQAHNDGSIASVSIAGPGFLNITLSDASLWRAVLGKPQKVLEGERLLLEYSCPNAFKELHTGHLYQTIVGDTLGRLAESAGAKVFRANFGGDVGLHVAKCLWGIRRTLESDDPKLLSQVPVDEHASWLSAAYVEGAKAYEDNPKATEEITELNQAIYAFHAEDDHTTPLAKIYWQCRDWSYTYFKQFYEQLSVTPFDKYYPESLTTPPGLALVQENIGTVFAKSENAIIFRGEDNGTHTRVFITSKNLPTYETKDLGVIVSEVQDFPYDRRVILTGNDQSEYMKVVFAALLQIDEQLAAKQNHISHGTVRFGDGKKMSSRLGNVLRAVDVLNIVQAAVTADSDQLRQDITLGAVKYAFLKQRLGGDIAFDVEESVSLQGNSGPYLQYAYARACSILAKASAGSELEKAEFNDGERSLVRKLGQYNEVIAQATVELMPHHICTYLYELAQTFNRFYEHNRVISDDREALRLTLASTYANTLKSGLSLLNIPAPKHM